jgi:Trypsin-like peptidase domain
MRKFRTWAIILLYLVLASWMVCGTSAQPKIPGPENGPNGKKAPPEDLPDPIIPRNPCPEEESKAPASRNALGVLRVGNGQCTGTVCQPMLAGGRWQILTASHCIRKGQRGTFRLKDGRTVNVTCTAWDGESDCAWLTTDAPLGEGLPAARLAKQPARTGDAIWHAGFGIDKPGNLERGTCVAAPDQNRQSQYRISVSPGDSGGGMFLTSTNELLSPVCCTTCLGCVGQVWAAGPVACARIRPGAVAFVAEGPASWEVSEIVGHPPTTIFPVLILAGRHGKRGH